MHEFDVDSGFTRNNPETPELVLNLHELHVDLHQFELDIGLTLIYHQWALF